MKRSRPKKRKQGKSGKRKRLRKRLEEVRRRISTKNSELQRLQRTIDRETSKRDRAARDCARDLARADSALNEARRIAQDRERDAERVGQVQAELAHTPTTRTVEEIDTFRYPIQQVQRQCTVSAKLQLQSAWANRTETQQLRGAHKTRGRSHQGYPRYGVVADPLSFALSDSELIGEADKEAAETAVQSIAKLASDYYAHMTDRALDMAHNDAHGATDIMLAMVLAAPGQLRAQHRAAVNRHLKAHYQLSDWRRLTK